MIKTIRSSIVHVSSWKGDLRTIMSFLFGAVLVCMCGYPYIKFACFARSEIQAFELYIICGSSGYSFLALLLGNILLLSNAPFVDEITTYEILRLGKSRWVNSKILYLVSSCIAYSVFLLIVSVIFSLFKGNVVFINEWSYAMKELAFKQPTYAIESFRVAFSHGNFIASVNPYTAVTLTVVCNSAYAVIICLLMMSINLVSRHNLGWLIAGVVHICGYIIFVNSGFLFPTKYSLFCHGLPAYYFESQNGFSIVGTISFVLAVFLVLWEIGIYGCKRKQL